MHYSFMLSFLHKQTSIKSSILFNIAHFQITVTNFRLANLFSITPRELGFLWMPNLPGSHCDFLFGSIPAP